MKKFVLASLIVSMGVMSLGCGEKTDPKAGQYHPEAVDPSKAAMPVLGAPGAAAPGGAAPAGGAAAPAGS